MKVLLGLLLSLTALIGMACGRTYVVNHTKASIVRVTGIGTHMTMFGPAEGQEVCTGFVVRPHLVLTANHCVGKNMLLDGLPTTLVKADEYFDLALYKVDGLNKAALNIREEPVQFDEAITAIGYGFGWEKPLVLNLRVVLPNHVTSSENVSGTITQGELVGGMSGGPEVDTFGEVVGVSLQTHDGQSYSVGAAIINAFLLDAGVE